VETQLYNPIELSEKVEKIVTKNNLKKYYRFRPTRFYGGIATADTVGCNLRCNFCWSSNSVWNAEKTGEFYSAVDVAKIISEVAEKKGYNQIRISGGEPTIGINHLIEVIKNIESKYLFILETNGILLGYNEDFVKKLTQFKNLHVRVCIKGSNPEEFSWFTGAKIGFNYQLNALENLKNNNLRFNIALVSLNEKKNDLYKKLQELELNNVMIEEEEIKLYPQVKNRLENAGILHHFQ